jgi:hypothetical protein
MEMGGEGFNRLTLSTAGNNCPVYGVTEEMCAFVGGDYLLPISTLVGSPTGRSSFLSTEFLPNLSKEVCSFVGAPS